MYIFPVKRNALSLKKKQFKLIKGLMKSVDIFMLYMHLSTVGNQDTCSKKQFHINDIHLNVISKLVLLGKKCYGLKMSVCH